MSRSTPWLRPFLLAAALLAGEPAHAADAPAPPGAPPAPAEGSGPQVVSPEREDPAFADESLPTFPRRALWRPVLTGRWSPESDLAGPRGTVAVLRGIVDVEGVVPVAARTALGLSTGVEGSSYDFSDPDDVVPGEGRLMEEGTEWRLVPAVTWARNDDWRFFAAGFVGSGWVPGADPADGMAYGGTFAVRRRLDGPLGFRGITLGATYRTAIEDDGYWFPILSFDGGGGGRVRVVTRGTGVGVAYAFTDRLAVGVSASYDRHDFRLADDDRIPGGVFRDLHVPVALDFNWRPTSRFTVNASVAVDVYTRYEFDDADGDEVEHFDGSPSVTLGLTLTLLF